jgi:curli biogenesis system outer membrane secretion channel CsgG
MKKILLSILLVLTLASCKNGEVKTIKDDKVETLREYKDEKTLITPKRKIAISSFKNNVAIAEKRKVGENLSDIMATELLKSQRFILLERQNIDAVMAEFNFSNTLGQGQLAQIQSLLDADFIVTGAITKYTNNTQGEKGFLSTAKEQKTEITFDFRIVDTRTGQVILADSGEGTSTKKVGTTLGMGTTSAYDDTVEADALRAAAIDVLEGIIKQVDNTPWTAKAQYSSGKLYINSGNKSNLKLNTKLSVYKQGKAIIFDSIVAGYEEEYLGEAKVTNYVGEDAAVCEYSGPSFSGNAIVRLK